MTLPSVNTWLRRLASLLCQDPAFSRTPRMGLSWFVFVLPKKPRRSRPPASAFCALKRRTGMGCADQIQLDGSKRRYAAATLSLRLAERRGLILGCDYAVDRRFHPLFGPGKRYVLQNLVIGLALGVHDGPFVDLFFTGFFGLFLLLRIEPNFSFSLFGS